MGLGEISLGEMGLGEMGLGEMGQNPLRLPAIFASQTRHCWVNNNKQWRFEKTIRFSFLFTFLPGKGHGSKYFIKEFTPSLVLHFAPSDLHRLVVLHFPVINFTPIVFCWSSFFRSSIFSQPCRDS